MDHASTKATQFTYTPIIIVTLASIIAGMSIARGQSTESSVISIMGIFLLFFSTFKWFDISGFVTGFSMYDPLAMLYKPYGYLFALLESCISISLLSHYYISYAMIAAVCIYGVNLIGATRVIINKQLLLCSCMGTYFKLPLGIVTAIEDIVMIGSCIWILL